MTLKGGGWLLCSFLRGIRLPRCCLPSPFLNQIHCNHPHDAVALFLISPRPLSVESRTPWVISAVTDHITYPLYLVTYCCLLLFLHSLFVSISKKKKKCLPHHVLLCRLHLIPSCVPSAHPSPLNPSLRSSPLSLMYALRSAESNWVSKRDALTG